MYVYVYLNFLLDNIRMTSGYQTSKNKHKKARVYRLQN
jgi:hypothetical protein